MKLFLQVQQILEWAKSDNAEAVLMEVKELAERLAPADFEHDNAN